MKDALITDLSMGILKYHSNHGKFINCILRGLIIGKMYDNANEQYGEWREQVDILPSRCGIKLWSHSNFTPKEMQ